MPPRSLSSPEANDVASHGAPSPATSPLVSVVVPFANDAAHLPRTLANLAQLDYPSLEFIFVNDAATDTSPKVVQHWISSLPESSIKRASNAASSHNWSARMRVSSAGTESDSVAGSTTPPPRVGVALAREHGVSLARGEWVWFCDSDDTFSPQIVSEMISASGNVDMVTCRAIHIEPNGRERLMEGFAEPTVLGHEQLFMAIAGGQVRGYLWNKLFRRSVLDAAVADIAAAHGSPRLSSQSDFMLVSAVAEHAGAAADTRMAARCIPSVGYHYRERAASISTGADLKIANTALCADYFGDKLSQAMQQSGAPPELRRRAGEYFRTWFYRVPCFTTPTHQRWDKQRRKGVQQSISQELTWTGLSHVARGVPELQLPAMPRIAIHGAVQSILGPLGLYNLGYALLRKGIAAVQKVRQFVEKIRGKGSRS